MLPLPRLPSRETFTGRSDWEAEQPFFVVGLRHSIVDLRSIPLGEAGCGCGHRDPHTHVQKIMLNASNLQYFASNQQSFTPNQRYFGSNLQLTGAFKLLNAPTQQLTGPFKLLNAPTQRRLAAFGHGVGLIRFTIATAKLWLGRTSLFPAASHRSTDSQQQACRTSLRLSARF